MPQDPEGRLGPPPAEGVQLRRVLPQQVQHLGGEGGSMYLGGRAAVLGWKGVGDLDW